MYYVYAIRSLKSKRFYYGFTSNVEKRLESHNRGKVTSTKPFMPWTISSIRGFKNKKSALSYEKKIKTSYTERMRFIGEDLVNAG